MSDVQKRRQQQWYIHSAASEKNEKKITCYNLIQCGAPHGFDYIFVTEWWVHFNRLSF